VSDLSPPETALTGSCADLWLMNEADVDEAVERYGLRRLLSAQEQLRHDRLRSARARRQHLGARMLVRYVLAAYTGVRPEALCFEIGPYGRPELVPNPLMLDFNISHTDGLIGCILTRQQRCGIDLEQTPPPHDLARALLQFLAEDEQSHVRRLPSQEQDLAVLDHWVLKEAYLKALGVGFTRRIDGFSIQGLPGPTIVVDDPADPEARWQLELCELASHHRLAVALSQPPAASGRTPIRILDFTAFLRVADQHPRPRDTHPGPPTRPRSIGDAPCLA
jgi:4'-phosphopantetheinyl transferase